ncbi:MAG: glycoside hydrolase family 88 protein [Odoribacteraceae bacterium]|jgi:rhamnogalacturonyl hydrolase YesR|nr:glycoside hydrolase family 88 protein [Odoribacteraceae bacterium]
MKKSIILFVLLLSSRLLVAQYFNTGLNGEAIREVMQKVADWQIAHQSQVKHQPLGWENAAMYMGMMDWAEIAGTGEGENPYEQFPRAIANRGGWQPAKRMYHADDICISQVYIDLYRKHNRPSMLWPTLARARWVIANPPENNMKLDYSTGKGLDKWSWCDALFMAPAVYVKLYRLTGDKRYMKFADKEFKETHAYLYDREEHLFFRDWNYFERREANGRKVFWGRGNGWVAAGLAEILKELPRGNRYRPFYERLFIELCNRLRELQQEDGYWRASLLDPDSYPSPETSSTGFILYAFAYGVNQGMLPAKTFLPAIKKGWEALVKAVEEDGKLGYVQPVGADPRRVTRDMTEVYGVGAFLMAGREIYRLAEESLASTGNGNGN